jgi:hypothetical protein
MYYRKNDKVVENIENFEDTSTEVNKEKCEGGNNNIFILALFQILLIASPYFIDEKDKKLRENVFYVSAFLVLAINLYLVSSVKCKD